MADLTSAMELEKIILKLHDIEAVKFGEFKLKSGSVSPVYFDLRVIVSYPEIMQTVSSLLWNAAAGHVDSVCGVPYTALPLATCIAIEQKIPMLIRRKEAKDYGTKKMIEGHFKAGDQCLIVEDVVTTGGSVLETAKLLRDVGLEIKSAVVLLDRGQGGSDNLSKEGIQLTSVLTMAQLLETLSKHQRISREVQTQCLEFLRCNQTSISKPCSDDQVVGAPYAMPYEKRAEACSNPISRRLFRIMHSKETNLAFSADVKSGKELLNLADKVGPHICILKTHVDILEDFTLEFVKKLKDIALKHDFLIFEDRKFADIGHTVELQASGGIYHIAEWADLVNAHIMPGPGVIEGLKKVFSPSMRASSGCLLVAEMSSKGALASKEYTDAAIKMAEQHSDFVAGFICQHQLSVNPNFIHMTPGVRISGEGDKLGQQYLTPKIVIKDKHSDVIIVGRGIIQATDAKGAAQEYQRQGFEAHQELVDLLSNT